MRRVRIAAVSVMLVLMAGGFAAWRLTRPPSFHEPTSVAALGRAVDDVVPEALRREHVPGVAVAVVRSGQVAWVRAYGVADAARSTAVSADTRFQVASVSKPVASFSISTSASESGSGLERDQLGLGQCGEQLVQRRRRVCLHLSVRLALGSSSVGMPDLYISLICGAATELRQAAQDAADGLVDDVTCRTPT